jgi:hypothetical protein
MKPQTPDIETLMQDVADEWLEVTFEIKVLWDFTSVRPTVREIYAVATRDGEFDPRKEDIMDFLNEIADEALEEKIQNRIGELPDEH